MTTIHQQKRQFIRSLGLRRFGSHGWADGEFQTAFQRLHDQPELLEQAPVIWRTRTRTVRKVTLPADVGGQTVAVKTQFEFALTNTWGRHSKMGREALNFLLLEAQGFPMVRLLAYEEHRRFGVLTFNQIITEFAEGYDSGMAFMPGKPLEHDSALRREFTRRNMELLGRLHELKCLHRGFYPYNLLWRKQADGSLEIRWLDVATCRFKCLPYRFFHTYIRRDLSGYFRKLNASRDEMQEALEVYCRHNPRCPWTAQELMAKLTVHLD